MILIRANELCRMSGSCKMNRGDSLQDKRWFEVVGKLVYAQSSTGHDYLTSTRRCGVALRSPSRERRRERERPR